MFITLPPPPPLASHVRMFWVFEHDVREGMPYVYRSMADGCAEMVFHYKGRFTNIHDDTYHPAILHAQCSQHHRFLTHESFGIFGVYLYPTAVPALFGCSSVDCVNQLPDLPSLLGRDGAELEERIMTAPDHRARVSLLSGFLLQQLNKRKQETNVAHVAVKAILAAKGQVRINELASEICLSTRQFERKFKEYTGFTPKLFTRIIRFHGALDEYGAQDKSLTDIAYECGYFDQSHFIHEFREFSGYHPGEYFYGAPEGIEYRQD
ncbi:helix-turn-helix domain-containing protein [Chitinophaga lutea]